MKSGMLRVAMILREWDGYKTSRYEVAYPIL